MCVVYVPNLLSIKAQLCTCTCSYMLLNETESLPLPPSSLDHQMESDEELPEYDEHVTFPSKLAVCFAASGGRKDIDSGDKIILSPQILIACEQKQLSYPMVGARCCSQPLTFRTDKREMGVGVLSWTNMPLCI